MGADKQLREQNPNWRGGRSIAPNGYVLLRVGIGHHLADVRGYAYEHRVVAEEKLGRRLLPGEIVHHLDENRQNNDPANIEVVGSILEHKTHHRKPGSKYARVPGRPNETINCACGCGAKIEKFDRWGRVRSFVSGHNSHG